MEPEPSRAMPVWAPSLWGFMRMVATTRVRPLATGWTLTSPKGSTTCLSCDMAALHDRGRTHRVVRRGHWGILYGEPFDDQATPPPDGVSRFVVGPIDRLQVAAAIQQPEGEARG